VSILARRRKSEPSQFERAADGSMTLMEHLRELRSRLLKACLGILVGFGFGLWLSGSVLELIQSPYCELMADKAATGNNGVLPPGWLCPFVQLGPTDVFVLKLKIALWTGLMLAAPIWLYQLWAFIAPGLHRHERRWAYLFAGIAGPLFALGGLLAYFIVGKGLAFLLEFNPANVETQLEITKYVDFVTGLMLLFGIAFEFPLGIMLANVAGVVTGRRLLGWWRMAVFAFFLFAAIFTPTPDPFGMTFLALALSLLYFGAVGFAFFNDRRRRRKQPDYSKLGDDEISTLDDYVPEPVTAGSGEKLDAVEAPEPIAKPLPIERRYDDIT
jgi:sec-independent protein translocase protein TatC